VVLAVALRVAHGLALRGSPWFEHLVVDPEYYGAWAHQIAAGDWLGTRQLSARKVSTASGVSRVGRSRS